MTTKTLRYWSSRSVTPAANKYSTPTCTKEAAVLTVGGSVLSVPMTSYTDASAVLNSLDEEEVVATFMKSVGKLGWAGEVVVPNYEGTPICYRTEAFDTLTQAVKAVLKLRDEKIKEAEALKADPAKLLALRVEHHDWWCMMSDDYSVTLRGEADMRSILELAKKVPAEFVRALWTKHAPQGFTCPV
jgi:hypothetical protein